MTSLRTLGLGSRRAWPSAGAITSGRGVRQASARRNLHRTVGLGSFRRLVKAGRTVSCRDGISQRAYAAETATDSSLSLMHWSKPGSACKALVPKPPIASAALSRLGTLVFVRIETNPGKQSGPILINASKARAPAVSFRGSLARRARNGQAVRASAPRRPKLTTASLPRPSGDHPTLHEVGIQRPILVCWSRNTTLMYVVLCGCGSYEIQSSRLGIALVPIWRTAAVDSF